MSEAFFEAVRQGDERAVERALADEPAALRSRDRDGLSPILVAIYRGHAPLAGRLADRLNDEGGELDVFEAAALGRLDAVRKLVAGGEIASAVAADGYTPLHLAAYFGRLDIARLLLEHGADVNAVAANESRVTPLHSAAAGRHRDVASLLLAFGASVNVVQRGGWTPLHSAARNSDETLVDLLLLRGADASIGNDDGRTPADLAAEAGNVALAEVLRAAATP